MGFRSALSFMPGNVQVHFFLTDCFVFQLSQHITNLWK